ASEVRVVRLATSSAAITIAMAPSRAARRPMGTVGNGSPIARYVSPPHLTGEPALRHPGSLTLRRPPPISTPCRALRAPRDAARRADPVGAGGRQRRRALRAGIPALRLGGPRLGGTGPAASHR